MSEEVLNTEEPAVKTGADKEYTVEDIQKQIKPLSENAFVRFFQKIWRWWLGLWYGFSTKHPKASKLIYMVFFFIIFSEGVTIIQFLIMTFLPFAFQGLWETPFVWPAVAINGLTDGGGNQLFYAIFNEPVKFILAGAGENGGDLVLLASTAAEVTAIKANPAYAAAVLQSAGLGNFIAFEIAVFIAQPPSFPTMIVPDSNSLDHYPSLEQMSQVLYGLLTSMLYVRNHT